jgi:hypothetical protein
MGRHSDPVAGDCGHGSFARTRRHVTRRKKWLGVGGALLLAFLGGTELYARHGLGLGDPPLTIRHSEIDYLFAPGSYERFGNQIHYNAQSMRADEVNAKKEDPAEFRVLVMGDSVINGGALTDDSELATRLAQERLVERLQRPVWVGNVSAGSWGPGNLLAYADHFGWFDADVVLFVLSSHDIADVPDFKDHLGPDFPAERPLLATGELIGRYLPRYLPRLSVADAPPAAERVEEEANLRTGRHLFTELLRQAKANVGSVAILHHSERSELTGAPPNQATALARLARSLYADAHAADVEVIPLAPYLQFAPTPLRASRDPIHINALGQRLYADAIICAVERAQGLPEETCV